MTGLADLHYREMSLSGAEPLTWDNNTAKDLVKMIRSIEPRNKMIEPE
jgi:hypothetical protein